MRSPPEPEDPPTFGLHPAVDIQLICDDPMCHGGTHPNVPTAEILRDSAADYLPNEDRRLADIVKLVQEAPVCGSPDCRQGIIRCFDRGTIKREEDMPSPWDDDDD